MADGVFVVFHHQHRVAEVTQRFERLDQPLVVTLVQTDGGFVQHVQHAAQPRTDLRGQADALAFAAGKRGRVAVQRKIAQPDGIQKLQPLHDLAAQPFGDQRLARVKAERRAACSARRSGSAVKSAMDSAPTLTASDSGRSRLPWQAGQVVADM